MPRDPDEKLGNVMEWRITVLEEKFLQQQLTLNGNLDKMWKAIDKLRNRPPTWASTLLMICGTVIGAMAMWILDYVAK